MLDIAADLRRWCADGRAFAVATVVAVRGSAPRQPGAALAVDAGGTAVGSVSGGCVEGAVYDLCQEALRTGRAVRETFGYSDDDAFAVGLTCGGAVDVLVTPVPAADTRVRPVLAGALAAVAEGRAVALARVVDGPGDMLGRALLVRPDGTYEGTLDGPPPGEPTAAPGGPPTGGVRSAAQGGPSAPGADPGGPDGPGDDCAGRGEAAGPGGALECAAAREARALLDAGRTGTVRTGADGRRCGPVTLLVECAAPPPRMIVFGAVDFAGALVRVGKFLGYHVTVCDARPVFATPARFPEADEVVADWPHRYLAATRTDARTALCVLTHDPKFDVPLLLRALRLPVAYVGAMGSRRTHADRAARLRAAGVTEAELARLRSPIGLDLGARTPEETALSIAAEIVADRRGGGGARLTGTDTPIHHDGEHDGEPDGGGGEAGPDSGAGPARSPLVSPEPARSAGARP
ncbi:XdhC family protein [Streptomyces sp. B1866]|uniref:XdhC family protein n=1 Tax=Streptomyces sp. B1866 TaxID=3075431 RepID=UPI00288F80E8|nr:XdhC family protein [Streptomyces sp. B1866]MDT3398048.1 XdhC family protein [Streptomyces sp. B1866]